MWNNSVTDGEDNEEYDNYFRRAKEELKRQNSEVELALKRIGTKSKATVITKENLNPNTLRSRSKSTRAPCLEQ